MKVYGPQSWGKGSSLGLLSRLNGSLVSAHSNSQVSSLLAHISHLSLLGGFCISLLVSWLSSSSSPSSAGMSWYYHILQRAAGDWPSSPTVSFLWAVIPQNTAAHLKASTNKSNTTLLGTPKVKPSVSLKLEILEGDLSKVRTDRIRKE